jgi:hypothetical protein
MLNDRPMEEIVNILEVLEQNLNSVLASDSLSNLAKSSLSIFTSSEAEYVEDMAVNPTISAYRMLQERGVSVLQCAGKFYICISMNSSRI